MPTTPLPYRLGTLDARGRRPVIIGENTVIGYASRWHREWDTESTAGFHRVGRPEVGKQGADRAAAYLIAEYAAGRITPITPEAADTEAPAHGPVPLLDPRMPSTRTNRARALDVWAAADRFLWLPRTGFPGSDNHWSLTCLLRCQPGGRYWTGPRYWSHLRGRNSNPPSPHRHPGCLSETEVRRLIPAYGPGKTG
ncbi:hypothetical protein [Streptomyces sp. NPDC001108]